MNTKDLYQEIVEMLSRIRNDQGKLARVFNVLEELNAGLPLQEIQPSDRRDYSSIVMQIADAINEGFICFSTLRPRR
ncbi:MAG: hypothetical protein LUD15_07250 [Bacteroides sp.]|nr:hypothetical protein [Bacteroides sp.]